MVYRETLTNDRVKHTETDSVLCGEIAFSHDSEELFSVFPDDDPLARDRCESLPFISFGFPIEFPLNHVPV